MSNRTTVIVSILEQFDELANPLWASGTSDAGDGRYPKMPGTYNASVREIDRLVREVMPLERPSQHWHLVERYFRCERTIRNVWFHGTNAKGTYVFAGLAPHQAVVAPPGGWEMVLTEQRRERAKKKTLNTAIEVRVGVVTWNPAVRLHKVQLGVEWIGERWSLDHGPRMPKETFDEVAA